MKRRNAYILTLLLCTLAVAGCSKDDWSSGDRVLVAKFLYDMNVAKPRRFDVVVFRYPNTPIENGTPKNYIKRLLGLPGELLAIFFGRLYRCPAPVEGEPPYFDDSDIALIDRWRVPFTYSTTSPDPRYLGDLHIPPRTSARYREAQKWFLDSLSAKGTDFEVERDPEGGSAAGKRRIPRFEIVRKPLDTMLAMRRLVYDNDFPAKDLMGVLPPRWSGDPRKGTLWAATEKNGFRNDGSRAQEDWLTYHHILRPNDWPRKEEIARAEYDRRIAAGQPREEASRDLGNFVEKEFARRVAEIGRDPQKHRPQLITDFLAYNNVALNNAEPRGYDPHNWVGDLMLECRLKVEKAAGEFCMELTKGVDQFQACWDLQSGDCTLVRIGEDGKRVVLGTKATRLKGPGDYDLRFANIDERLTVWVDRELPFDDGVTSPPPAKRGPTRKDLQPARLGSKGAAVQVSQVKLWRDTYYTVRGTSPDASGHVDWYDPGDPDKDGRDGWTSLRELPHKVLYVQPGHYLCLGDNSPQSSDSREWGTVPERLMLGRALMVYFPFDRAGRIK
jgi:signal peptidase I